MQTCYNKCPQRTRRSTEPPSRQSLLSLRGNDAEQESLMKHFKENVPPTHNRITYSSLLISTYVISRRPPLQPIRAQSYPTGGTHQCLPGADGCCVIRMVQPGPSDITGIKINGYICKASCYQIIWSNCHKQNKVLKEISCLIRNKHFYPVRVVIFR